MNGRVAWILSLAASSGTHPHFLTPLLLSNSLLHKCFDALLCVADDQLDMDRIVGLI